MMNEVKQALNSLRSPTNKTSKKNSPTKKKDNDSRSTWYDTPAPVIVHCREFAEEAGVKEPGQIVIYENNAIEPSNDDDSDEHYEDCQDTSVSKKRHSSSVEITALTTVKTDPDTGVPTISFSFLHPDSDTNHPNKEQLELYDIPKPLIQKTVVPDSSRQQVHQRSTRSLKSERRSYSNNISTDTDDAGIASMSSSYSDPDCSKTNASSYRGKRQLKLHRRRFGRAWGKMRTWLREETIKFNDVVNRHAKLQAVGAFGDKSQCVSYDLTKATPGTSMTKVEEFGLTAVAEEIHLVTDNDVVQRCSTTSPDSGKASTDNDFVPFKLLRKKTLSSGDILDTGEGRKLKIIKGSFSMDKLSEIDANFEDRRDHFREQVQHCNDADEKTNVEDNENNKRGKGDLIKKRMLGSIRGLMASTHLIQSHESDEVL